jgi:general secretion pathway protein D
VVYLKNADAVQLANTLRAAMAAEMGGTTPANSAGLASTTTNTPARSGLSPNTTPSGQNTGNTSSQVNNNLSATGGQIQADPATNSLIITRSEPVYRQMRAVIDMLDTRRAQVYVESLIAEVNADKRGRVRHPVARGHGQGGQQCHWPLGHQLQHGRQKHHEPGSRRGHRGALQRLEPGPGQRNQRRVCAGLSGPRAGNQGDGNVLSTPNLLTLDNEEAKIVIGQNVPFVTGQFTNTGASTGGTVNPFQTIERKDVGLTLKVKPQISESGTIKLSIFQEVSSIDAATRNNINGPNTNKRSIESQVLVDDGQIVVLGGLLQDEYSGNVDQVPGFGDVPVIGNLFKSQSRGRKKTNLMVFLRPVVVRDARQTETLAQDRYDMMRTLQQRAQPEQNRILGINEAPVLPERMGTSLTTTVMPATASAPALAKSRHPMEARVRYPLPYAFARENLLLLEQDGDALSLHWAGPDDARTEAEEALALQRLSALSEVMRVQPAPSPQPHGHPS